MKKTAVGSILGGALLVLLAAWLIAPKNAPQTIPTQNPQPVRVVASASARTTGKTSETVTFTIRPRLSVTSATNHNEQPAR